MTAPLHITHIDGFSVTVTPADDGRESVVVSWPEGAVATNMRGLDAALAWARGVVVERRGNSSAARGLSAISEPQVAS